MTSIRRTRVYIAGPMSGHSGHNFHAFDACKDYLRAVGYRDIVSPADVTRRALNLKRTECIDEGDPRLESFSYAQALATDLPYVCRADLIVLLPGWSKSRGTAVELKAAEATGKTLKYWWPMGGLKAEPMPMDVPVPVQPSITQEADGHVSGARQIDYGHPLDNWTLTADIATPIVKKALAKSGKLLAEDMLLVMQAVKIAREMHAPKRDNRVDGAGYWQCTDMAVEERRNREFDRFAVETATGREMTSEEVAKHALTRVIHKTRSSK